MKKPYTFSLDDETYHKLIHISAKANMRPHELIEFMIIQRFKVSDVKNNQRIRREGWENFSKGHDLSFFDSKAIYVKGYNQGWIDFQVRHGGVSPIIRMEDDND